MYIFCSIHILYFLSLWAIFFLFLRIIYYYYYLIFVYMYMCIGTYGIKITSCSIYIHYYWYRIQSSILCKVKVFLINLSVSAYSENSLSVLNFWRIALLGIGLLVDCWFLSELVLWHISLWHLEYMLRKCL